MLDMAKQDILPACISYTNQFLKTLAMKKSSGLNMNTAREEAFAVNLSNLTESLIEKIEVLDNAMANVSSVTDALEVATYYRDEVFASMLNLRVVADELETIVSSKFWPFPTYAEILFNI